MRPSPSPVWDPRQYARHSEHRERPLRELLARVPELPHPEAPRIADLGCGPGGPSLPLAERWPGAHITGYDSSPEMLAEARTYAGPLGEGAGTLDFAHADLAVWRPDPAASRPFDLLFSNAALQWVRGHVDRFPDWLDGISPGGALAFQVPGNFDAPSHTLLHELRDSPRWRARLGGGTERMGGVHGPAVHGPAVDGPAVHDPAGYAAALAPLGCTVDAWETTYLHLLQGEDPVLDWVKGTALRPVLTLLADDPEARDAFLADYRDALREAYPAREYGVPFPFRRIFVVAVKKA
jgi:trans-aconitate 2-methyltransferase